VRRSQLDDKALGCHMTKFWVLVTLMLASACAMSRAAQNERSGQQGPVTVDVKGPVVIGFFPPFTEAEESAHNSGITEGLAHAGFALADIAKCYGNKAATYRFDITRSVTLRDGSQIRRIDIPRDSEHSVGIIFAMPGRPARTVFAAAGPSSLVVLGPAAAAEYFGAEDCRANP
jgi:hypothetical protein